MTNEERDMEIVAARQVCRSELVQRIRASMEKAIHTAWQEATTTEERETLYYKDAALQDLFRVLVSLADQPTTAEASKYESV